MASNKWIGNYDLGPELKMLKDTWIGSYYVGSDSKWIPDKVRYDISNIYGYYSTEGYYGHTANHLKALISLESGITVYNT